MRKLLLMSIVFATLNCYNSDAQEKRLYTIGEIIKIHSNVLNEDRILHIYLPNGYSIPNTRYPVLYVLDSPDNLISMIGLIDNLSSIYYQSVPNMIIVGIDNNTGMRNRDLLPNVNTNFPGSGGADNFILFLKNEIISFIDSAYKTLDFRILYGHSSGASFASYVFTKDENLFNAYFAISPAFGVDTTVLTGMIKKIESAEKLTNYFYFAVGGEEGDFMISLSKRLYNELNAKYPDKLNWNYNFYEKDDHNSIRLRSMYDGIEIFFSECRFNPDDVENYHAENVIKHIDYVHSKYNCKPLYPPNLLVRYANKCKNEEKFEEALLLLNKNTELYPEFPLTYYILGTIYESLNKKEQAILNYELHKKLGGTEKVDEKIIKLNNK